MGYSRGSRPGSAKAKLCWICSASFPDAQERKKHYYAYNCRDAGGNIGGIVTTGNCNKVFFKPRQPLIFGNFGEKSSATLVAENNKELVVSNTTYRDLPYDISVDILKRARQFKLSDGIKNLGELMTIKRTSFNDDCAVIRQLTKQGLWEFVKLTSTYVYLNEGCPYDFIAGYPVVVVRQGYHNIMDRMEEYIAEYGKKPVFLFIYTNGGVEKYYEQSGKEWAPYLSTSSFYRDSLGKKPEAFEYFVPYGAPYPKDNFVPVGATMPEIPWKFQFPTVDLCCRSCHTSGCGDCEIAEVIFDSYQNDIEAIFDLDTHRAYGWYKILDLLPRWMSGYNLTPKEYKLIGFKPSKWIEVPSDLPRGPINVTLDSSVVIRKLPFVGRTPFELMLEYNLEPTGVPSVDLDRVLNREFVEWREQRYLSGETRPYIIIDGGFVFLHFVCWREQLMYYWETEMRGYYWTQKQFDLFLARKTPSFLSGYPELQGELEAAGWFVNPLRWSTKQATLGFLDGCIAKVKELLGSVWESCTLLGSFFTMIKDKVSNFVNDLGVGQGPWTNLTGCMLPISGLLGILGLLNMLCKISGSLGVSIVLFSGAALGLLTYVLVNFLKMQHHKALKRAKLIWEKSQEMFKKADECDEALNAEILNEITEGDVEFARVLEDLDREKLDHISLDMDAVQGTIEAAGISEIMSTGIIWKILLLILPVSCVGFKNTVSTAKDLSILYGGKEAAGKFTHEMIGGVQELYYSITGQRAQFLGYMYNCVGVDFEAWRNAVVDCTTSNPNSIFLTPPERLRELRKLKDDADKLILQMDPRKIPGAYVTSFNDHLRILDKSLAEVNSALSSGQWRKTPFCVWLYGASHVGKSVGVQYLINDMLDEMDYPESGRIYARNGTDAFFSCYKNQVAVLYDDFAAVQEGAHFDESEIIRLIAPAPMPLNMASVEAKGNTFFTSDFVFITANQKGLTPTAVVHNKAAFENRRNIMVEVKTVPGGNYRERYQFQLLSVNEPYNPIADREPMKYDEFLQYCVDKARDWQAEQQSLTNAPHGCVFTALKEIFQELKKYQETCIGVEPCDSWCEIDMDKDTVRIRRENFDKITYMYARHSAFQLIKSEFLGSGLLLRLRQKVSKAAFKNLRNQITMGVNPLVEYASEFGLTHAEIQIAKTCMPKVTLEALEKDRISFKGVLATWWDELKRRVDEMPFVLKCLLGIGAFFCLGYPLVKFLSGLWACRSAGEVFSLATGAIIAAGSSIQGSGDSQTRNVRSGKDRRKFIFEGSAWSNKEVDEEVEKTKPLEKKSQGQDPDLSKILKNVLGFQALDNPNCKVRALALGGTRVAFIYHVWVALEDGCYMVTSTEKSFPFTIIKERVKKVRLGKKDIIIVDFQPTFVSFPKLKETVFPTSTEVISSGKGIFAHVCFENLGRMDISLEDADYATNHSIQTYNSDLVQGIGLGTCMKYSIVDDSGNDYQQDFFVKSQCGTLLLGTFSGKKKLGRTCILSLHSAHFIATATKMGREVRGGHCGFGMILTQDELLEATKELGDIKHCLEDDIIVASAPMGEEMFFDAQTVRPLGLVKPQEAPTLPKASAIIPSLIARAITNSTGLKPVTEPAVLHKMDARAAALEVDILKVGMLKYSKVATDMSPITDEEVEIWEEALDDVFEPYQTTAVEKRLLTEHENLNGVPGEDHFNAVIMSTSEGWPWVLERENGESGKMRLLSGIPGEYRIIENSPFDLAVKTMRNTVKNKIPCIVGLDTPKDERLPLMKTRVNIKTRLFTILPFEYNYLVREFFGMFIFHSMRCHNSLPMKVGIAVTTPEWTVFGKALHTMGSNWFNGDYARFDGVTPRCLLVEIARKITQFYGDEFYNERLHLLLASTTRLGLAGTGLYRVSGGIPSGFALTVVVNSLVNQFLVQWSWRTMVRDGSLFSEHVVLGVYGDDNICSVSDIKAPIFNLRTLSAHLKQFGFTLKDGSNKELEVLPEFNRPEKCDFLKRHFKAHGDRYLCPLSDTSRNERLFWIRTGGLTPEVATAENCTTFLAEIFQLGEKKVYDEWRKTIIDACYKERIPLPQLRSFREQEASWLAGKSLTLTDEWIAPPIVVRRVQQEIVPGVQVVPCQYLTGVALDLRDETKILVWCGPNCPEILPKRQETFVVQCPYKQKYPLRSTFRELIKKISRFAKERQITTIMFGGALDQDLVYFCAAYYASYTVKGFSFSDFMLKLFDFDEEKHKCACVAAIGWSS